MKPVVVHKDKEKVQIRADCRAEGARKHVERVEVKSHDEETIKYSERKLTDKGVQRLERHPADGLPLKHLPKKGHGGKYTWEGPDKKFENELEAAPPAIDGKDPNYMDDEQEEEVFKGEEGEVSGLVVGEVEVPKVAEEGVARIEVNAHLKVN